MSGIRPGDHGHDHDQCEHDRQRVGGYNGRSDQTAGACEHWASHRRDGAASTQNEGIRRRVVLAAGTTAAAALAGCSLWAGDEAPEPVTLTTEDSCDVCGMVIPNHPGPVAEIFYADEQPSDHDNPAHFCSTWEAFQYNFERLDRDWTVEAFYVTDYSGVDYEIRESGGDTLISSHPDANAFTDAEDVTFVVGSAVKGAMGQDLIGFADRGDAESFQDEYDGQLAGFDEVTRETVDQLGMA